MEKEIYRISPIVIYPECIKIYGRQDNCFTCLKKEDCQSPRSFCIRPYKNHPKGCPNYGIKDTCPPHVKGMYDEIFDAREVYAVVTKFDLEKFFDERRKKLPMLAEGQIRNLLVWQQKAVRENNDALRRFYENNPEKQDFVSTRLLECLGVDVVGTMKEVGIDLKFPVEDYAYRIAFLAKTNPYILEELGYMVSEKNHIKLLEIKKYK